MSSHRPDQPASSRRCDVVPPSVTGELLRLRLVEVLAGRWDVDVTTVIAGAGLGKSTALAQAIRHNHANPRGVDAWVSCEPGDEDADQLADAIVRALGVRYAGSDPASAVTNALRSTSPVSVCLVLDDLHVLPERCSAVDLLQSVLQCLPAHAHLVLAGRTVPALALARLRAADRVVDVAQDALTFTGDELGTLAASAGRDTAGLESLGGWPALVRLALGAPGQRTEQFVWEEVVSRLSTTDLRALLALATMGTADADTLHTLCGEPVDMDHLVATVPMVDHTGDGRLRAHDLWHGTLTGIMPATEVGEMGRAAAEHLLAAGSYVRAGSLAARLGDIDALCTSSLALVRNTLSALPVDTAAAWLRTIPPHHRDRPELVLLDAVTRHYLGDADAEVDALVSRALAELRARGDDFGEQTALGFRLVLAHTRGDAAAALELVETTAHLTGIGRDPTLRVLGPMVEAIGAHLVGEVERGAAVLDDLCVDGLPPVITEVILRFHWHMLVLAGRAGDAARLAPRVLAKADTPNAPLFRPVAQWLAGDPSGFDDLQSIDDADHEARAHSGGWQKGRDWFNFGYFTAMVGSSFGSHDVVARGLQLIRSLDLDLDKARNGGPVVAIRAVAAILDHDDERAEQTVTAFLDRFPISDRFTDVSLGRFLTVPYVCSPEARRCWDDRPLGPSHRLQREVGRCLLAARDGTLDARSAMPPPAVVFTALPLPWSVELAVRADAMGNEGGRRLGQWLVDRLGPVAHRELRRTAAASTEGALAQAARRLLGLITLPPQETTRIELLGPLRTLADGDVVVRPEQRRARVRELLAVLTIHPTLGRDRAMDLLWPDLGPVDAARNLRVTLTHLRRWLEPERERGEQGYHLRADATHLRLVPSERLSVDLWDLHHHLRAATAARTAGDAVDQAAHLEAVVALWRGDSLRDLERVPDLVAEAQHLQLRLVDSVLTLGELRLAEGDGLATLACAERALVADRYDERAFRLLIAAHLLRGDRAGSREAVRRTLEALAELGVDPDSRTAILLRQAGVSELAVH